MYPDSSSKSEILNKQFQSVFTKKTPQLLLDYSAIKTNQRKLIYTLKRVQKLLEKINISKAAGPDLIPGRMLNMLAPELAPIVHAIFIQSLETGELPRDWSLANVAPIFKKGNRVLAENYRPVSLTCITCKQGPHSFSFFELKFKVPCADTLAVTTGKVSAPFNTALSY